MARSSRKLISCALSGELQKPRPSYKPSDPCASSGHKVTPYPTFSASLCMVRFFSGLKRALHSRRAIETQYRRSLSEFRESSTPIFTHKSACGALVEKRSVVLLSAPNWRSAQHDDVTHLYFSPWPPQGACQSIRSACRTGRAAELVPMRRTTRRSAATTWGKPTFSCAVPVLITY